MSVCTFFGHRNCPIAIKELLRDVLVRLIEENGVDTFYVGNNGAYDRICASVLQELAILYPQIKYGIVLAYMPKEKDNCDYSNTMFPEGMEDVHPHYAISRRNQWMLRQSDYVVTYVTHSWGGAAQFADMARRQKKTVINLTESEG